MSRFSFHVDSSSMFFESGLVGCHWHWTFLMTWLLHIQLTGTAKLYRIPVPRSPSYGPIPSLRYHHWPNYHNMGKRDHSLAGAHPKVTEGDSANGGDSSRSERRTVPNGALGSRFNDGLVLKLQGWVTIAQRNSGKWHSLWGSFCSFSYGIWPIIEGVASLVHFPKAGTEG